MDLAFLKKILPVRFRIPRFPIAVQFTREGMIFILLSLAIGAAAVNTGNNVLYFIFSLMLGLIVVSGFVSRRMLMALSPNIEFPQHIFSGVKSVCYLSVDNHKSRIPSLGIRFVVKQKHFSGVSRYFFMVPARNQASSFAPFLFNQRGVYRIDEMELQTKFPFSFFTKIRRYFPELTIKVYPQIYKIADEGLARFAEGLILESPYRGESDQLLHLRDYSPQDSSKRVHWKASARLEKLLVKEFQREQGREISIHFDCYPGPEQDPEILSGVEKALSLVASLGYLLSDKGFRVHLFFGNQSFDVQKREDLVPLLDSLSEWKPETAIDIRVTPPSPDSIVLLIRSKRIPPRVNLPLHRHQRIVFLEEWERLLKRSFDEKLLLSSP